MKISSEYLEEVLELTNRQMEMWGVFLEIRGFAGGLNLFLREIDSSREKLISAGMTKRETYSMLNAFREVFITMSEKLD